MPNYVDSFAAQLEQAGMRSTRSTISTQIAGVDAEGAPVRAVFDGQPGGWIRTIGSSLIVLSVYQSSARKEISQNRPVRGICFGRALTLNRRRYQNRRPHPRQPRKHGP